MPYTTVVAGTTITASWGNANVRDQVVTPFASASARTSAVTVPVEGMVSFLNDVNSLDVYNGAQWVSVYPSSLNVNTIETTTSTTYTDLSTSGPAVSLATGTSAIVTLSTGARHSSTDVAYMGVAVSGASTVAANDNQAAECVGVSTDTVSLTFKLTGLTAGTNTFTCKYRTPSGTATYQNRNITVWGLP